MTERPVAPRRFFYRMTDDIRVTVYPRYSPGESLPEDRHFVFPYRIRIENVSRLPARLMSRYWVVADSDGAISSVQGEGVVGEQPTIPAGGVFEYQSMCVLPTPRGSMEGEYQFVRVDGTAFRVAIPYFPLDAGPIQG